MLTEITRPALDYICLNMREVDWDEVRMRRPHDNRLVFAREAGFVLQEQGRGRVAWHDGRPAAVIGFIEHWPGTWDITMFGTDDFKSVAFECMRWARETAAEFIRDFGGKRLQCDSREGHHEAHKFLVALGARREGEPMRLYGKDGSSYLRFVWIAGENDHRLGVHRPAAIEGAANGHG